MSERSSHDEGDQRHGQCQRSRIVVTGRQDDLFRGVRPDKMPVIAGDLQIAEHINQSGWRFVSEKFAQRASPARPDRSKNPLSHPIPVDRPHLLERSEDFATKLFIGDMFREIDLLEPSGRSPVRPRERCAHFEGLIDVQPNVSWRIITHRRGQHADLPQHFGDTSPLVLSPRVE